MENSRMLLIRTAGVNDVPLLLRFSRELADYERQRDTVVIKEETLIKDGFGSQPKFRSLIAEWDGQATGLCTLLWLLFKLQRFRYLPWGPRRLVGGHSNVTLHDSLVPATPRRCHSDRKNWQSWHSLRAPGQVQARNLRPRPQWAFCAGSH